MSVGRVHGATLVPSWAIEADRAASMVWSCDSELLGRDWAQNWRDCGDFSIWRR